MIHSYVLHYTEVDPDNARFSGTVDIDLDVKEETNFVMLNAKELCVVVFLFTTHSSIRLHCLYSPQS